MPQGGGPGNYHHQSAVIRFFPHRDGVVDNNWNVTYSESSFADWSYDNLFGAGVSSHRTTLTGAYVVIDWAGTAVWLYGTAVENSYTVAIDGNYAAQGQGATDGVLFGVSITGAIITVGMGDPGTVLHTRNISATESNVSSNTAVGLNPIFSGTQNWSALDLYTNQTSGYPCIATNTVGATLSFNLSDSVGFAIYGSDDWQQGLFSVSVISDDPGATSSVAKDAIQYSSRSLWSQLDMLKYLATGLDRTATYQVEITNLGADVNVGSLKFTNAELLRKSGRSSTMLQVPAATSGRHTDENNAAPLVSRNLDVSDLYEEIGSRIHERDAGPAIHHLYMTLRGQWACYIPT
ncbi:uncharacterized protein B0H18DRAFT_1084595 [Fomitopsis serialis]|uniref:uncharacterized protein n=1 Tax=Fomitopsis serialis TaxID=139415 RepID=UPI00200821B9|nr:uncharacterized protein B0H18DRAFT_1084595 [Neoantrodia serialis]KAH9928163.1 hypothetical protein B0H18DRAFT_1084595 [Neoantrodia serialis]